jgi:hypothetical protein
MTIVSAKPDQRVDVKLEFLKPWASTNQTSWILQGDETKTKVTWAMDGKNSGVIAKTFSVFMDLDKMVGSDFERGLSAMKNIAEKEQSTRLAAPP